MVFIAQKTKSEELYEQMLRILIYMPSKVPNESRHHGRLLQGRGANASVTPRPLTLAHRLWLHYETCRMLAFLCRLTVSLIQMRRKGVSIRSVRNGSGLQRSPINAYPEYPKSIYAHLSMRETIHLEINLFKVERSCTYTYSNPVLFLVSRILLRNRSHLPTLRTPANLR